MRFCKSANKLRQAHTSCAGQFVSRVFVVLLRKSNPQNHDLQTVVLRGVSSMGDLMQSFSMGKYSLIISEIRDRFLSAQVLSHEKNVVFIESTALQIRKILELIAYLSVLVNAKKLNHDERSEYHASKIVNALTNKTTIFYPLPSLMYHPSTPNEQPHLIPLGYEKALSQADFHESYKFCGSVLHAQHPLKKDLDIEAVFKKNNEILNRLKVLLQSHTIGIMNQPNMYTFLHVEIDFSNHEKTKPSTIREYNTHIFSEQQLFEIFNP
jgi:hypothetical protein